MILLTNTRSRGQVAGPEMNWAKQHNSEALVFFHFNMLFQKADTKTYLQVHVDATAKRVTQVSVQQVRIYLHITSGLTGVSPTLSQSI